jgi:CheY-like chemotaxis protein
MSRSILLIEDEPGLVMTISDLLSAEAFSVQSARDGDTGLAMAADPQFDLIILEVMLPRRNGFEICRALRERGIGTPILMLRARAQITDRVVGLRIGAHDYLVKPFDPAELLARIEALLRRSRKSSQPMVKTVQFGQVEVDFEKAEARKNAIWWKTADAWWAVRNCFEMYGNTRARFRREPSIRILPGCGRNWKSIPSSPTTSTPFAARAIASASSRALLTRISHQLLAKGRISWHN